MENLHLYFTAVKNIDTNYTMEVIGSNVQWKEGQDPSEKIVRKTVRDRKTKDKHVITSTIPCDSFFNVFKSVRVRGPPEQQQESKEDVLQIQNQEQQAEFELDSDDDKVEQQLEDADDIAEDLYELYTKNALACYLGFGPKMGVLLDSEESDDEKDGSDSSDNKKKRRKSTQCIQQ